MAQPSLFPGSRYLVFVGDGANPEVFSAPCGLTTKTLSRSATFNGEVVPDCENPEAPGWLEGDVDGLTWTVSGAGKLARESVAMWDSWFASGLAKNVRIEAHEGEDIGRVYSGKAYLTTYDQSAERGQKVSTDVTLSGTGPLVSADLA